jgi:DNA-binding LacI/PurR family transcriptional regulator
VPRTGSNDSNNGRNSGGSHGAPRIKDLAERLGVSASTVSRALNDKPGVAAGLRKRVLELAAEMDFTPNRAARSLIGAGTFTVGFVFHQHDLPVSSDTFYLSILRGVERELAPEGYHVMLNTANNSITKADHLRVVRERLVDGLIMAGPNLDPGLVLSVAQYRLPMVLVDNSLERTPLDCVMCDDRQGARSAVEHLIWHEHRRIAFVGGPETWASTRERKAGYLKTMRLAGLEPVVVHESATSTRTGMSAGRKLFALDPRPTAVFAVNDAMAIGVIRAAREARLAVPEDVAVVGFDDVSMAESADPPLTTVRIAKELMGMLAARRLLSLLSDRQPADLTPVKSLVSTTLTVRSSCGCAAE